VNSTKNKLIEIDKKILEKALNIEHWNNLNFIKGFAINT
jgi:hypothetical protein